MSLFLLVPPDCCRDGGQRQVAVVRFGPLEAVSPDAAMHHIDAAAASMEVADARLGDTSGGQDPDARGMVQPALLSQTWAAQAHMAAGAGGDNSGARGLPPCLPTLQASPAS